MATDQQVNDFKATIMWQQSNIGNIIVNLLGVEGREGNEDYLFKFKLINIYSNIIIDYFSQSPYNVGNFFTIDEIQEVILRLNHLMRTNYSIEL